MVWGLMMASSENVAMAPAHAHLNLLGWATLSLMGTFYALLGERAPTKLGWVNFVLSLGGVIVTIPALAKFLEGNRAVIPAVAAGSMTVFAGMITFLIAIAMTWRKPA
jgi:hypothetical protein